MHWCAFIYFTYVMFTVINFDWTAFVFLYELCMNPLYSYRIWPWWRWVLCCISTFPNVRRSWSSKIVHHHSWASPCDLHCQHSWNGLLSQCHSGPRRSARVHLQCRRLYALRNTTDRSKGIIITTENEEQVFVYGAQDFQGRTDSFLALPLHDLGAASYTYIAAMIHTRDFWRYSCTCRNCFRKRWHTLNNHTQSKCQYWHRIR